MLACDLIPFCERHFDGIVVGLLVMSVAASIYLAVAIIGLWFFAWLAWGAYSEHRRVTEIRKEIRRKIAGE